MSKTTVGHFTEFVGHRIGARRKAKKMPLEELARKIGVSATVLDNMERGLSHINLEQLMQCARWLSTTAELLGLPHHTDDEIGDYLDKRIRAMSEEDLRRWQSDPAPLASDRRRLFILDIRAEDE